MAIEHGWQILKHAYQTLYVGQSERKRPRAIRKKLSM
jgi:hypothetical protein